MSYYGFFEQTERGRAVNQTTCRQQTMQTFFIPEQRRNQRHQTAHLLAITPKGTGKITDISKNGLAFGCLYAHSFKDEWTMDILDAKGSHIKKIKVRKMWEKYEEQEDISDTFDMEVGIGFIDLTNNQERALDNLINDLP